MVQLEDDRPQTGETCYVAGWGRLHETGNSATKLQELAVDIIDYETCNTQESYDGLIQDDTMMCAGFLEGGKDACQGDSGGPLICVEDGQPVLQGLVSWGYGCARPGAPGIYARVGNYMDWIQDSINERVSAETTAPPTTAAMEAKETCEECKLPADVSCPENPFARSLKIVGGTETEENSWPWIVRLSLNNSYLCGGSVINENWVLTAAHCCGNFEPNQIQMIVGDHNKWATESTQVGFQIDTFNPASDWVIFAMI